jgi:putative ABC transport system permease protein
MFSRLVVRSFVRNPRRKLLGGMAVLLGMTVATATLTVSLDVGDRLAREFRSFGANILVRPQTDSLPLDIGGVDYQPVNGGAWLPESELGKLKTIFWRHNVIGFTPFLELPVDVQQQTGATFRAQLVGSWYAHDVPVPDGTKFRTGLGITHPWWKVHGHWFADGSAECVVGDALAARAGIRGGQNLELISDGIRKSVTVTGILSTGGAEDQAIVAPLALAQELSGHPGEFRTLFVSAITKTEDAFSQRNPDAMTPADYDRWFCSPYISSIGRQIQQVLPGTEARPIRRVAETEGRILTRVSSLFWLVTLAALIAAALAVSAISATSILERRSEIGLLKALGATDGFITILFLGELFFLAVIGGVLGFLAGLELARVLGQTVFAAPAEPRLVVLPLVLGLAVLVTLLGSIFPLRQAARIEPAATLRGE